MIDTPLKRAAALVGAILVAAVVSTMILSQNRSSEDIWEAAALDIVDVNVAEGKPAWQSSSASGRSSPSRATDGNSDCWKDGHLAITERGPTGWWEVDLQDVYQINKVCLRLGFTTDLSLHHYRIVISHEPFHDLNFDDDWSDTVLGGHDDNYICLDVVEHFDKPVDYADPSKGRFTPEVHGRFVRVQLTDVGQLSLCEVEVWGGNWVDKCASHLDNCNRHADCIPLEEGNFDCVCRPGYLGNGHTCKAIDYCAAGLHDCDHQGGECVFESPGEWKCRCKDGYEGDGVTCTETEEPSDDAEVAPAESS